MGNKRYTIAISKLMPIKFLGIIKKKDEFFISITSNVKLEDKYRIELMNDLTLNDAFEAVGLRERLNKSQQRKIMKYVVSMGQENCFGIEEGYVHIELLESKQKPVFSVRKPDYKKEMFYSVDEFLNYAKTFKKSEKENKTKNALER